MYKIRLGGTNEFVSEIDPTYARCYPPGKVEVVKGWNNPNAKVWENLEDAKIAEKEVWKIESFHTSIEEVKEYDE
jgi:hypothetical protein